MLPRVTGDDLRAAILASPRSIAARRVYADWLIEQGDPRGEWINLHASDSDEAELKRRALWQHHGATWRAEDGVTGGDSTLDHQSYVKGVLGDIRLDQASVIELAPVLAKHPIQKLSIYNLKDLEPIASLPVLATVDHLDLGYGLEHSNVKALRALLEATPRLTSLTLSPHQDVKFTWEALEGFSRLGELETLDISSILITKDRAKWLASSLPKLRELRWSSALTDAALTAIAERAAFQLTSLYLSDRDGYAGRSRLFTDEQLGQVLQSPFTANLEVLSLFGCPGRRQVADALANLPCSAKLKALDLGSMESSECVSGLELAELPKLEWLSVRHNVARDSDLEGLTKFSTVRTLRIEKNPITSDGVKTVLEAMPNLVTLSAGDSAIGDYGVIAIAYGGHARTLRHLEIDSSQGGTDAIDALIDSGNLTELRTLGLACNEDIKRAALQALADGPFDKLAHLSLAYVTNDDIAPLFADAWLPAERGGEHTYQRKLALDGTAVPHTRKAKKKKKPTVEAADARPIDATADYQKGEHVRHSEYGVGVVTDVELLSLHVKFPRAGEYVFGRTPAGAVPFSVKQRYVVDQIVLHPKFGAGKVVATTKDKVDIEFSAGDVKTLIHGRT
jgi:uncharacterized protein (TIGR02996 family)